MSSLHNEKSICNTITETKTIKPHLILHKKNRNSHITDYILVPLIE